MQEKIIVKADPELADLIPGFLEKRKEDVRTIQNYLRENRFQEIQILGHNMKGCGEGYGFSPVTEIGAAIEIAAAAHRGEEIEAQALKLDSYLGLVEVVYEG